MSALAVVTGSEDRAVADLDLVAGVRAGDDRAFEQLFVRYQPRIAAYVAGMVRDHARAEDITQEVFLSALRRLRDGTDHEIQFRPWIYEIARNKCIDAYRRGRHAVEVSFDAHEALGADDHGRLAGPRPTPDDAVEDKLALDNLCGAFGGLSAVHHDILVMREFEGLSYREIGERLGLSRPAVESTLFRARKRLSEEYEQLVSGERCELVQRTVDASRGIEGAGLRDQRRITRHLAHCQPCRRYARLAGADLGELAKLGRARAAATRVAALLPMPAFLRWGHVAGTLDPGTVTGWTKAVATAATVAVAGVGAGSAISDRAGVPAQGAFASPVVHVAGAGTGAPPRAPRAMSPALQTSGAPAPQPTAPAGAVPAPATPAVADADATPDDGSPSPAPAPATPTAPATAPAARAGVPLDASTDGPVKSLLDRVVGDRGGSSSAPAGGASADTPPRAARSRPIAPLIGGALSGVLPGGPRPSAPAPPATAGPQTPPAPPLASAADTSLAASAGVTASSGAAGAPTAKGGSVRHTVRTTITSTTAALTGRGG